VPRLLADTLPWAAQLGFAAPFALALAFVGRWLIRRLEESETAKEAIYEKVIEQVVPALTQSTDALAEATELLRDLTRKERR
jgi:membrane protein implicated in regulation of membrane protease activity